MGFSLCELPGAMSLPRPAIEWEETNCLLCGGRQWNPLVEAPDSIPSGTGLFFVVVQCQSCGLCFTNPRPSATTIGQFYPSDYEPHQPPKGVAKHRSKPRGRKSGNERRRLSPHGVCRLLDFGCGGGSYLERMHRQGWEVTGLDVSPAAVQRVRELGLNAYVGTLPHPELRPASFDVITMWQVLEHVHQPLEVLRAARRLLVPGGRLIVAVPNIDSLPFRWFGHAWYGLDLPRHLVHFAPPTLEFMLQRAGFQVRRMRLKRHSRWLRSSADLACRLHPGLQWRALLKSKVLSRLTTWYGFLTNQSDCILVTAETGEW